MDPQPLATPNITVTSTNYDSTTGKSSVTFSWYKASDGATGTELIRYDVYDTEGNYYAQAVELGKTIGEFASGTVTVNNITPGIKVSISVYVSTDNQNSSATETFYSPTGRATFSNYTWNDTRTSCEIKATAPGAKYLRIVAGTTPDGNEAGEVLAVGANGTLTVSNLNHGNGEALYLSAIPESSDGHQYGEGAAYSQILVPNPILGIFKSKCGGGDDLYIVDILEKKEGAETCTPRWQNGQRVKIIDRCPTRLTFPAIANVQCIAEENAPFRTYFHPAVGDRFSQTYRITLEDGWTWDKLDISVVDWSNYVNVTSELVSEGVVKISWVQLSGALVNGMTTFITITEKSTGELCGQGTIGVNGLTDYLQSNWSIATCVFEDGGPQNRTFGIDAVTPS